jgi:lipoprotein-anchoring transpeptidase ErfK/SrfK
VRRLLPALLALAAVTACGEQRAPAERPSAAAAAPAATPAPPSARAAAFAPRPARPAARRGRHVLAALTRPVLLRAAPGGRPLARLGVTTEFGSPRVLGVVGRRRGWLRVLAAELPNGRRGWIPARAVEERRTDLAVHVDRSARELTLRRGSRVLRRVRVAVGRPGTPTPTGRFAVTDELRTSSPDSPYGCCAIALTGHQTKLLPGWPGGDRLAIHGTPLPETIGRAVSLGCLRAAARDLRALMRRLPLGAPVFVRA